MERPESREDRFRALADTGALDVLIVGGGMTGAPVYHELCRRGHRVAIVDRGDFSSGTSQASGMLVWGGLLYLKSLDVMTVVKLCRARRDWLERFPEDARVLDLEYRFPETGLAPMMVWLALQAYWLLGGCALRRPRFGPSAGGGASLSYQEGMLCGSDSRFVIDRLRAFDTGDCLPLNHCELAGAGFDRGDRMWRVGLRDRINGGEHEVRARVLVNGAGVWTDAVNRLAGLESPVRHVFSKGVYLALPRGEEPPVARIHPMVGRKDVLTHVPWGPVMMWGPTETRVDDPESGLAPDAADVRFLLEQARHSLPGGARAEDVVSIRCGVRPLVVPRNFNRDVYPLDLSRRHRMVAHRECRALSLYGGKLTSSMMVAGHAADAVEGWIPGKAGGREPVTDNPETWVHSELGGRMVTAEWARDREFCVTLDDYLRRRTTIAQWTPRMGLGKNGCGRRMLLETARVFHPSETDAVAAADEYGRRVRDCYDPLLAE